ncbi:MAG: nitroreductase family protein [Promethearchaeota archaeon]
MSDNKSNEDIIENSKVKIFLIKCIKCKICLNNCPRYLFRFDNETLRLDYNFEEECIECGHCVSVCPENVIKLKKFSEDSFFEIEKLYKRPSYDSFLSLAKIRRSTRCFRNKIIPKEKIEKLLEAARYSPTGHNQQNVFFTVIKDRKLLDIISKEITNKASEFIKRFENSKQRKTMEEELSKEAFKKAENHFRNFKKYLYQIRQGRDPWKWNGELIIIHSPQNSATLIENCTLAACHIMLAAETLSLATCSLGYITAMFNQHRDISKLIDLPNNHIVGYTLAIGEADVFYYKIPAKSSLKVKWL